MEETQNIDTVLYGGFWRRVAAAIIDNMICLGVLSIIGNIFFAEQIWLGTSYTSNSNFIHPAWGLTLIAYWLYDALFTSSHFQATPGKLAVGVMVTDYDYRQISFGQASLRHFASYLSGFIMFIGYIMVAFTEKNQGLHDFLARTYVVRGRT
ncbi:MAG: RDD family protein [Alphaproteobacteria bacterium]